MQIQIKTGQLDAVFVVVVGNYTVWSNETCFENVALVLMLNGPWPS